MRCLEVNSSPIKSSMFWTRMSTLVAYKRQARYSCNSITRENNTVDTTRFPFWNTSSPTTNSAVSENWPSLPTKGGRPSLRSPRTVMLISLYWARKITDKPSTRFKTKSCRRRLHSWDSLSFSSRCLIQIWVVWAIRSTNTYVAAARLYTTRG